MAQRYTEFEVVNGNLMITLTPEGREFITAAQADGLNIDSAHFMFDLFEWQCSNGWESIAPEEIGALTDCPILSDSAERDDHGRLMNVGRVYWFPNYRSGRQSRRSTRLDGSRSRACRWRTRSVSYHTAGGDP